jgi:hypothetical protein
MGCCRGNLGTPYFFLLPLWLTAARSVPRASSEAALSPIQKCRLAPRMGVPATPPAAYSWGDGGQVLNDKCVSAWLPFKT